MSVADMIHNHSALFMICLKTSLAHISLYLLKFISFSCGVCLCMLCCTAKYLDEILLNILLPKVNSLSILVSTYKGTVVPTISDSDVILYL